MVSRLLLVAPLIVTGACSPADQTFLTPLIEPGTPLALIGAGPEALSPASEPPSQPLSAEALAPAPAGSLAAYAQLEAGEPGMAGMTGAAGAAGAVPVPNAAPVEPASAEVSAVSAPAAAERWRAAYPNVVTSCFPQSLRRALTQIANHFDREVLVTSGERQRGRRGSMHRSCQAADIRVDGVAPGVVATYARKVPGLKGVGTYRWVSVTHVDVRREAFTWRW